MKQYLKQFILPLVTAWIATAPTSWAVDVNLAEKAMVSVSSFREGSLPDHVKDGVVSDASRWLAGEDDHSPWVELTFSTPIKVGMIDVFSGWKTGDALKDFDVAVEVDGAWQRHKSWVVRDNAKTSKRIYIDRQGVTKIRLELLSRNPGRIREIAVYDNKEALGLSDMGEFRPEADAYQINFKQHQIAVNQIGYLTDRPKRFTAPLSTDGTKFTLRAQDQAKVLYQGVIHGGVGDFTSFKPEGSDLHYVIEISDGELKAHASDPFLIRKNLAQEEYWQAATDFLNDVRSVVGTHPSAYGGCGFRDGTYYDAIVPSLVLFYLSDPAFIDSMPRQIDWQAEKERVTASDFVYIKDGAGPDVMDAIQKYYQLEAPHPKAPDVVKILHWGAGYILMKPNGRDPSASLDNDNSMIEPQTVEQIAYVLWAWPVLKKWLPQSFYDQCLEFCLKFWEPAGGPRGNFSQGGSGNKKGTSALEISPWWNPETYMTIESFDERIHNPGHMHPFKGRHAPGHSIVPNLLMHEVALREGHDDADTYLEAAVKQADWIIKNLDWNDPRTTKGHRLSEHRTIPNLVWLLQKYPDHAPAGLKEKITEWGRVAVSRSHNLWDFRKFSNDMWTIPGMNEVGNSLSLPAIALSASWVVDDPELKTALERIAFSSVDHVFGRNPMLHAAASHPGQGFPEIERGWPKLYKEDVCARLETVRGNIASLPGSEMYPFSPGKKFRHLEGWANYGASWCISLSYLRYDELGTTPDMNERRLSSTRGTASIKLGTINGEEEMISTSGDRVISGVYPHLTTYSQSRQDGAFFKDHHNECGIGAVIPWADKLWMVTYAPHQPRGSDHKLYSIDQDLNMTIHAESVGGTPAARMIHEESGQLFIAHYAIDKEGNIRVIDPKKMPARVTAIMRHLTDPENYIYLYDMENMFYEVNVHTLEFTRLFEDPIPGYHGKGGFTSQGKVIVSNNGETNGHLDRNKHWQVSQEFAKKGPEDRGCLATFDGSTWEVIERRQYTEVTGPEGVAPTAAGANQPVWAIGWDKRSLRLQVMENGAFSTFLLPKGCLNNDAKHGWFTEWPRIRDIGENDLMMDMHGLFFKFPKTFSSANSAGIEPIGSHIRYIPDFCFWNEKLVLATDEASIQGNPMVGQPQSGLWIGEVDDLKEWGPRNAAGSIYMNDPVVGGVPSAPFLINGFPRRVIHLGADRPVAFKLQIDREGNGEFEDYLRIEVKAYAHHIFPEDLEAQWLRVKTEQDCNATVSFHFSDDVYRDASEGEELFKAIAHAKEPDVNSALLFPAKRNRNLRVLNGDTHFDFTKFGFEFQSAEPDVSLQKKLTVHPEFSVDEASVILTSKENRSIVGQKGNRTVLRLPKGPAVFDQPFSFGYPRMHREVESERMMANIHGTFYEVPFWLVGQPPLYTKMRPVCTHNKQISDFTTWNGLLVLAGLKADAEASEHVYKTDDEQTALWFGGIDDLWKFGKPVGVGGPWKNTDVKAGVPSDPYLMTGYDKKTLELTADKDCTITVEVDIDHWTGFHPYKSFKVKAGEKRTYEFSEGFAAHWLRIRADKDINATAWLIYE